MYEYSFKSPRINSCDDCGLKTFHETTLEYYCGHPNGPEDCSDITKPVNCPLVEKKVSDA